MSELKIYVADFGVYGCEVFVAKSKEDAYNMWKKDTPWTRYESEVSSPDSFEEFEIKEGHITGNQGDS